MVGTGGPQKQKGTIDVHMCLWAGVVSHTLRLAVLSLDTIVLGPGDSATAHHWLHLQQRSYSQNTPNMTEKPFSCANGNLDEYNRGHRQTDDVAVYHLWILLC